MIKLKLSFGENQNEQSFDIEKDELLSSAIERVLKDVPKGEHETHDTFNIVVNGHVIEKDFWPTIKLSEKDEVVITPKIKGGESGQIFKQIAIITITVVASFFFPPAASLANAFIVAGITIGATLALNALIPPPVPELGGIGGSGDIDNSQMYSITGQSNQMKRLGVVPKVYGVHRIFPTLAATPYTELAVDPDTGETIQYLYAIYDFGLGTPQISDLKIGDTPLTTDSFEDFEYRFVDINRPQIDEDEYDEGLNSSFILYTGDRTVTPLSIDLEDGEENIQVSDENTDGSNQEIILDFICPRGLFGFTSNGNTVERSIRLEIEFALVGTSDWRAYNDPNYVSHYRSVGGTDLTDFQLPMSADNSGDYYETITFESGNTGASNTKRQTTRRFIKRGINKLLVPEDERWTVGAKVFSKSKLLGVIDSITDLGSTYELTLDRTITSKYEFPAYDTVNGGSPTNFTLLTSSRHESKVAIISGTSQSPVYGNFRFTPTVPGQYQVRVRRISTSGSYGTQKSDDLTWGAITTAFQNAPIHTTKRHVFMELKIRATNQLNGHIQNLSGIASSVLRYYDPDTQSWPRTVTTNPAWVFCDLLTGEVNKKAVSTDRLHMESILEWAEYCEEVPTPPDGETFNLPRFECNFILDYDATLQTVLAQVGGAAQASLNIIDGKYGVLVDRFKTTPVQIFTPRNSRDFTSTRVYGPRPHAVKVKYIDPNLAWEIAEVVVYDNGYDEVTATEFDELTSFACTNNEQAWRFGRYMIAQNKLRQETISILVDFEHIICTRGDYVQVAQDVMRVGGTPARVKEVSGTTITIDDGLDINPSISYGYTYRSATGEINTSTLTPLTARTFDVAGDVPAVGDLIVIGEVDQLVIDCLVKSISPNDDLSAQITLVEKADEIWDYESTGALPEYDPQLSQTSRPDWYPPKAVVDLEIGDNFWECSQTKSGYNYYAEFVWNMPPGSVFEYFEIWINDGRGYRLHSTTTAKYFRYNVEDQTRLGIEHGFKVAAVSVSGKKLQLIEMPEILFTPDEKTTAPSDVESLNMSITNQVLQLSWPAISDCDCAEYQIRFSPDSNDIWEASIPLTTVSANVNSVSVQARTGIYLIKAIDFNGNQSANAAEAITTIPNLFDLNVIETLNDAPTFSGSLEQTELLGEAVILQQENATGDADTMSFYEAGYYVSEQVLDLDDVYTARLQSQIRADGYKYGELMSNWTSLTEVENLNTATSDDWDVEVEYRATDVFAAMSDWASLSVIDHINYGAGVGFTDWRPIPTIGDATGRIFQFRMRLESLTPNVTPRLFDASVKVDMPDRVDSFENQTSHASEATVITYNQVFKGPGTSPNVQISIDNAQSGDYWTFDYKTLEGFAIRFYDNTDTQVVRQFDVVAKGYGRRHTATI